VVTSDGDVVLTHYFRDDRQADGIARTPEKLYSFGAEALKIARRRARFERTAAKHRRTADLYTERRFHYLAFGFNRTRPGDNDRFVAAKSNIADANYSPAARSFLIAACIYAPVLHRYFAICS
jgi:hypothetical protein